MAIGWEGLPSDVLEGVFDHLEPRDVAALGGVSRSLRSQVSIPHGFPVAVDHSGLT
jgi:hypothetical protein